MVKGEQSTKRVRMLGISGMLPLLGLLLVWSVGSGWWYTCQTHQLCTPHQAPPSPQTTTQPPRQPLPSQPQPTATTSTTNSPQVDGGVSFRPAPSTPSTTVAFFFADSADFVSDPSIEETITYLSRHPNSHVSLTGYWANVSRYNGSPAGIDVANARVETVKQRIVDGGIDAKRITSSTRVADNELDTFDYDALARARRVEVTISD